MIVPLAPLIAAVIQDAPAPRGSGMAFIFQIAGFFLLFYFIFLRPQQKQRRQHEDRIRRIKRGDEIVTSGGVIGEVVHIREGTKDGAPAATMEDRITIKSGDTRLIIERGRIAKINTPERAVDEKTQ